MRTDQRALKCAEADAKAACVDLKKSISPAFWQYGQRRTPP
jgi:hypothetical protein